MTERCADYHIGDSSSFDNFAIHLFDDCVRCLGYCFHALVIVKLQYNPHVVFHSVFVLTKTGGIFWGPPGVRRRMSLSGLLGSQARFRLMRGC
jgi:hypothetical protein